MNKLNRLVAVILVVQFVLCPGGMAWGQVSKPSPLPPGPAGPGSTRGPVPIPGMGRAGVQPVPGRGGVVSQTPAESQLPGGQALSRAVVPDQYILGPGDGLSISLWGEYDANYVVWVTPDGKISLPTIGNLSVKGLSLTEAESLIQTEVKRYYRNVKSGLSLTSLRVFEVQVLGEILLPGTYLATPVKRVSDLIAQAGGALPGGSQRRIQVQKTGQVYATADIAAFLRKGDQSGNPYVHDGDVIFVPPMGDRRVSVYISEIAPRTSGATGLIEDSIPYTVELKEGERLSTLISEVGGVSPWWDLEGVFIQRVSEAPQGLMRIPADLRRYYIEGDESQNVLLERGDQVYIPASIRRVLVAGAVKLPAAYVYVPGRPADAYLMEAGGASLTADLEKSFIKRADGAVEPYVGTTEVNNGDSIVVLEKTFKNWQDYIALAGFVTGLFLTGFSLLVGINALNR
jgi:protein involved in polysaccharide export with SLBB domain